MEMHTIKAADALPGQRLRLTFADGFQGIVDLPEIAACGGVLSVLATDPGGFAMAEHGRALVWGDADGDEVDLCADALRSNSARPSAIPRGLPTLTAIRSNCPSVRRSGLPWSRQRKDEPRRFRLSR
jgi:hypothetical protein